MSNSFEFVGKLILGKESEKWSPYTTKTSDKGYVTTIFQPTMICEPNSHFFRIMSTYKKDGTGVIFTLGKNGKDAVTGVDVKGEKLQIDWNKRNDPKEVEKVAEFKKFVIDLEEPGRRYKLEKALERIEDGSITEENLNELGLKQDEVKKALEDSCKKRKEFIHEHDFIELLNKLIKSGKLEKRSFKVNGDVEWTEYQGKFRKNLIPKRVYLAEENATPYSIANITVFFKEGAVSESKDGYLINAFVRNYDNGRKEEIPVPIELWIDTTLDSKDEKKAKTHRLLISQFTSTDEKWREIGLKVKMLNGAQKLEITDDMLNDFQREMIEIGAMTYDDVRADLGGDVYGDKVEKMIIETVSRGYTKGRKDTLYEDKDFEIKEVKIKDEKPVETNNETTGDNSDIFAGLV